MTKPKSTQRINTTPYIVAIWSASVLTVLFLIEQFSLPSEVPVFTILALLATVGAMLVSALAPFHYKNKWGILAAGTIASLVSIAMIIDMWHEVTFQPDTCGSWLAYGNCFLLDGIGIILYAFVLPVVTVVSSLLLTLNVSRKSRQK